MSMQPTASLKVRSNSIKGMTKHWKHPVICSHITAKLVLLKIRMDAKYLTALPLNQPEIIENVEVTLLDANHCPGSVMFLFKVN